MIILVCGSRDWHDASVIRTKLSQFRGDVTIVHGGCRGADVIAESIARELGFSVSRFDADWERYGRSAGVIRNQRMLIEGKPERVIAFHDDIASSRGTKDMVKRAKNAGIIVEVVTRADTRE